MNLCREEFNMQPDIVITKRLGRAQPTKIRPLLIVTRKIDQAQHLIAKAKLLRKSLNLTVRNNVFINRNLTKAEAEAAYCVRVQQRQVAVHHTAYQQSRGTEHEVNVSNKPSDIDVSLSLLSTASNPNTLVPLPPSSQSRVTVSNDPTLSNITAPPAADQFQQQGRHNQT